MSVTPRAILVVTSCTGAQGVGRRRCARCRPSELYAGQQHRPADARRLSASGRARRPATSSTSGSSPPATGSFAGADALAPYEQHVPGHVRRRASRSWRERLGIPAAIAARSCASRTTSHVVLLGDDYLDACELDATSRLGGPTLVVLRRAARRCDCRRCPACAPIVAARREDTRRFSLRPRRAQGRGRRSTARCSSRETPELARRARRRPTARRPRLARCAPADVATSSLV